MAVSHSRDGRGQYSTIHTDGPGLVTAWHAHASLVLGHVVAGRRRLHFPGGSHLVDAGDGFIIPPDHAHAWGVEVATLRILVVDPRNRPVGTCVPAVIRDEAWHTAFEAAFQAVENGLSSDLSMIVTTLLDRSAALAPANPAFQFRAGILRKARQYAVERLDEPLTLTALGRKVGLSPWHLHRLYRENWGLPPAEHRLEARLRLVRAALLDGSSVAEAATAAGFADQSHLCRAFRRLMGVPPSTWLRQIRRRA